MAENTEGSRSFNNVIAKLEDGDLHTHASSKLHELTRDMRSHALKFRRAAKGSFALTLELSCDEAGVVTVVADVKSKGPKEPHGKSILWLTPGGNLTAENPRQQKLPLAEVPRARDELVEVPATSAVVTGPF